MTIFIRSLVATVLFVGSATAATADSTDTYSGFYIGVEGGYGSTELGGDKENNAHFSGIAGYRYQFDSGFVLGAEGAYGNNNYASSGGYDFSDVEFKNEWTGSGLVGFAFGSDDANLIYGTVGYMKTSFDIIPSDGGSTSNRSENGVRFGIGYERRFMDMVGLRLGVDYAKPEAYLKQARVKAAVTINF